ncbi:hypothetical protein L207DRAFT_559925 [Hyaloscypha variabilis F]|uniref:Uncharacterized protein n=1 Tax=Hyaloscypha variabilis (strain UAMH 11265 / GT02V1 / F) TaxID=1149755 RepID=A0A2J6SBS7_HYAVF|nr:hypothetical protein L207DRAFT_559925 [Hyaloscypha variabilis F]
MIASRTVARATARQLRPRNAHRQLRFATTNQQTATVGGSSGLVGGLAGGGLVFLAGYAYYHFSGAKSIVNTASATKQQLTSLTKSIQNSSPEPNEALQWLKSTATSYAAFIPGAKPYVENAFTDLETIQEKHGDEVNKIVERTYNELKDASKSGVSMETASKSWEILQKAMAELGELASDSASEILERHPKLKEQVGGNLDKLKEMTDGYGGEEAKKELEQTYKQIKDVLAGGFSADTVARVKKVVEEKTEKVKKLGDEAWKKGLEQAKPYLDKNPKVKEMVEKNADALKQGNVREVFEKVKKAVETGNTDDLKAMVKQAGEKAKNSGVGQSIEQYAKMIPGGSEIVPQLVKLQEVAKKRGDQGEDILMGAYEDVKDVLKRRIGEAEKLAEKAKDDAKQ